MLAVVAAALITGRLGLGPGASWLISFGIFAGAYFALRCLFPERYNPGDIRPVFPFQAADKFQSRFNGFQPCRVIIQPFAV